MVIRHFRNVFTNANTLTIYAGKTGTAANAITPSFLITLLITTGKHFLTHSKGLSIKGKKRTATPKYMHIPHEERTNILNIPKIIKIE